MTATIIPGLDTVEQHFPAAAAVRACWLPGLFVAAALACALVVTAELFWRSQGHVPSVTDDKDLWALERSRIPARTPNHLVIIGDSHSALGVSLDELRRLHPGLGLTQLSIDGTTPGAVLADLADDPNFGGIVLASITANFFDPRLLDEQRPWVHHYHRVFSLDRSLNRQIATALQSRLNVVQPHLSLRSLIYKRRLPERYYLTTHADRSRLGDYSLLDRAAIRASKRTQIQKGYRDMPPADPEVFLARAREVNRQVRQIHERGGRVAFVHFPLTDDYWDLEEEHFPRRLFWDRIAAESEAVMIHFRDVPEMQGFDCPDMSHIDARDVPRFTRALAGELVRRGVLTP